MDDFDGAESIARALCWIGAARHSKDAADQGQIAKAIYHDWAEYGDEFFKPDEALREFIAQSMGIDPKKLKKAP